MSIQDAEEAYKARDFDKAISIYSQVIKTDHSLKAQALIGRARSRNRKEDDTQYLEAVADATEATRIDPTLTAAHKERAIALYNLEEYEASLEAFRKAEANESTNARAKAAFREWVRMCQTKLGEELDPSLHQTGAISSSPPPSRTTTTPPTTTSGENKADNTAIETIDGLRKIVIGDKEFTVDNQEQYQELLSSLFSSSSLDNNDNNNKDRIEGGGGGGGRDPKLQQLIREQGRRQATTTTKEEEEEEEGPQKVHVRIDDEEYSKYWSKPLSPAAAGTTTAMSGYRHQWFQSSDKVEVNILARNMKKEQVKVDIKESTLYVSIAPPLDDSNSSKGVYGEVWEFKVDLYGPVVPEECKYELLSSKVEIKLKKAAPISEWKTLEKKKTGSSTDGGDSGGGSVVAGVPSTAAEHPPAPYSSGKSLTDWNKIGKSVEDEEEADHDPMKFFKELYQNADEDTRRAMLKSYQQSGGSSLTTNWDDAAGKDFTPTNESVNADVKKFEV